MTTVVERNFDYGYESVRSRISWGAILAGAAVALAIYALLMALGVAVGMSVSDDVDRTTLGTSAGVWGFISLLVALFAGGWVTTQVTTGESRTEAILYGVVLWATTSVLLIWITTNGARVGIDATRAVQSMTGGNQVTATDGRLRLMSGRRPTNVGTPWNGLVKRAKKGLGGPSPECCCLWSLPSAERWWVLSSSRFAVTLGGTVIHRRRLFNFPLSVLH